MPRSKNQRDRNREFVYRNIGGSFMGLYRRVSNVVVVQSPVVTSAPTFGVRHSQVMVLFLLIFIAYGIRVTLSVAIVAMTDPTASSNPDVPTYPEWHDKSIVLSAFFWGYILPQIVAGWMAGRFGAKWFLVGAMGACGTMCLFLPLMAASFGSKGVMVNRAFQGFSQGFLFPCVHHMLSQWVPPDERSRLGTLVYAAGPFGTVVAMLVTGAISASSFGWPVVFYLYGGAAILWCILSAICTYNSPADHPRIGEAEKYYIESSLGHTEEKLVRKTPWKEILTSLPMWAILISHCGQNWGFWTLMTEIPSYMGHVMNFNIKSNSILSALPYFVLWILSFAMSFTSDSFISRHILSVGHTRKLYNTIGLIIPAIALVFLGFTPADEPKRAVALLVVAVGFNSGIFCGFNVNHVDISPNHAGTLMGITNGISNIFGIVAPLLVQFLVTNEEDPGQWQIIFFLTSIVYVAADTFYVLFGSGEVQEWNEDPEERGPTFGIRHLQIIVLVALNFLAYGIRVTISVAIVSMTDPNASSNSEVPTFPEWRDKSVVLSAFFWGYFPPQIIGGWMAGQYGPKWILVIAMGTCGTMCTCIPLMAAMFGSKGVMVSRAFQGLCQGVLFPCVHNLLGQWVPPHERSRMGTLVYAAGPLGTVVSMLVTGAISASHLGWPWVFYLFGVASILWCILGILFIYNRPADHPKISLVEKNYIEISLGYTNITERVKRKTPWKKIFSSLPLWAILVSHSGQLWGFWTLMTEIPSYMRHVMNFNIKSNSMLSALPYFTLWILSFFMSFTSDYLISKGILSVANTRKLFNSIGLVIPAIALILLGLTSAEEPKRAVALLVVAVGFNSGVFCGFNINHLDISPNYAGTLFGITNEFANITGVIAPLLVHHMITNEHDPEEWKLIFFLTAFINVGSNTFFVLFASGEVQEWNQEPD